MFARGSLKVWKNSISVILLLVVLLVTMAVPASGQIIGTTVRISVASDGSQGNGDSWGPSISTDGRYVVFNSTSTNLISGDTNGYQDVFVHDRHTGQTTRVSVASDGTEGNNTSFWSTLSANGRDVAFISFASNLVSDDTNGYADVFVHDRQTGQTTRVSISSDGTQGNNDPYNPSLSADGRYVAFETSASNLIPGDTNGVRDIFIHDRQTGQTTRVSVASDGTQGNGGSNYPFLSADGRYVAFQSFASNLVSGDTNGVQDIFVHDRQTGQTTRVSVASNGIQGNNESIGSSLSADGRYVAFQSSASNLVSGDTNGVQDIFIHDRQTGQTTRVSVASEGTQGNNVSGDGFFSADGRYVAFVSLASNLVSGDDNGLYDIFVHDREGVPEFIISGSVRNASGGPIANVTVTAATGSATTRTDGSYSLTLPAGIYTMSASRSGYTFSPERQTLRLTQNISYIDFVGVASGSPVAPFLDLPFNYGGDLQVFEQATRNWSNGGGWINSWFDHNLPNYSRNNGTGIVSYRETFTSNPRWVDKGHTLLCYGAYCYDGHNGYDIGGDLSDIRPVANGTVVYVKHDCVKGVYTNGCGGFGNNVVIDHHNGYYTLYGHLDRVDVVKDENVTRSTSLGVKGNTGNSTNAHLHFGAYRDNGNGVWDGGAVDKVVDPFGWKQAGVDPWVSEGGPVSTRLWIHNTGDEQTFSADQAITLQNAPGTIQSQIQAGTFAGTVTMKLDPSPVSQPSAQLRSIGHSFWETILEYFGFGPSGLSAEDITIQADPFAPTKPIVQTVKYTNQEIRHIKESQLAIYHWDESAGAWQQLSTTVNAGANTVVASTMQLGQFDVQGPLVCPSDSTEVDDSYVSASQLAVGSGATRWFDIAGDQDWFRFDAIAGQQYQIATGSLGTGVSTALELYGLGGTEILASDTDGGEAYLEWTAPLDGTYFVRVFPASGSAIGCSASYQIRISGGVKTYLPLILKNHFGG
jgi:murein DD-endopeptidase MepM/ murein hydrolase activator NlpD